LLSTVRHIFDLHNPVLLHLLFLSRGTLDKELARIIEEMGELSNLKGFLLKHQGSKALQCLNLEDRCGPVLDYRAGLDDGRRVKESYHFEWTEVYVNKQVAIAAREHPLRYFKGKSDSEPCPLYGSCVLKECQNWSFPSQVPIQTAVVR